MRIFFLILVFLSFGFMNNLAAQQQVNLVAVKKLGKDNWNDKRGTEPCFSFTRGTHKLRLEDVNIFEKKTYLENDPKKITEIRYWGTFTIAHRRFIRSDLHIYIDFIVVNGKIERLNLTANSAKEPVDVLKDPTIAAPTGDSSPIAAVIQKVVIGLVKSGEAQIPMSQSVWLIVEGFRVDSMQK